MIMHRIDHILAWRRGVEVAIRMACDAGELGMGETSVWDDCRDGRPQVNPLLRAIDQLHANGDRQMLEGFCAVVNDLIGRGCEGSLLSDEIQQIRSSCARPIQMTTLMPAQAAKA